MIVNTQESWTAPCWKTLRRCGKRIFFRNLCKFKIFELKSILLGYLLVSIWNRLCWEAIREPTIERWKSSCTNANLLEFVGLTVLMGAPLKASMWGLLQSLIMDMVYQELEHRQWDCDSLIWRSHFRLWNDFFNWALPWRQLRSDLTPLDNYGTSYPWCACRFSFIGFPTRGTCHPGLVQCN